MRIRHMKGVGEPVVAGASERSGAITGSIEQLVEAFVSFADMGVTRVEVMPSAGTLDELEQLGAVFAALR